MAQAASVVGSPRLLSRLLARRKEFDNLFEGGVHTHGDGVIHVHPTLPADEGEGARLVQFFANAGGVLGERSLELPGDRPWRDGNVCAGGRPGREWSWS